MKRLELSAEENDAFAEQGALERVALSFATALGLDIGPGELVVLDDGRWAIVWNDAVGQGRNC